MSKTALAFVIGGVVAVGCVMAVIFSDLLSVLPLRIWGYGIFLPLPAYFIGAMIGGVGVRTGVRGALGFGVSFLLPGYFIPLGMIGSQGAATNAQLIMLLAIIPGICYFLAGAIGAGLARYDLRFIGRVAAELGVSMALWVALVSSLVAWSVRIQYLGRLVSALVMLAPWYFVGRAVAAALAATNARRAREKSSPRRESISNESPPSPSSGK